MKKLIIDTNRRGKALMPIPLRIFLPSFNQPETFFHVRSVEIYGISIKLK